MKFAEQNDKRGRLFLFGGLLTAKLLPYILHTVILLITQRSLGTFMYELCNVIGLICGLILGYFAVGNMGFTKVKDYISCLSAIGLSTVIMNFSESILLPYIAPHVYQVSWVLMIIYVVLAIIVLVLLAMGLMNGLRKIIPMIVVMAMCLGFSVVYLLLQFVLSYGSGYVKASFSANMMFMILFALVETLFFYVVLAYVRKAAGGWEREEYSLVKRNTPVWIVLLVLIAAMGLQKITEKPEDALFTDLQENLAYGDVALVQENLDLAVSYYERVVSRVQAWKYAFDEEYNHDILNTAINKRQDLQLRVICWEKDWSLNSIQNYLMYEDSQLELGIKYLDMLHTEANIVLGDKEAAICKDIIGLMIANNQFRDESISLYDLQDRKDKIVEKLKEFDVAEETYNVISLMSKTGKAGDVPESYVYKMLDYADEYRDNLFVQRLAVIYGSALKGDNAGHYERTINAAIRYEKLYSQSEGVTEEDIKNCRITVAQWIIDLGDYNTALGYLEPVIAKENNKDAVLLAARCYDNLDNYAKCRQMAELILEETPDNAAALYYCAITNLKEGNTDEALSYTAKICQVMENAQGEEKHDAEVCLYSMVQYLTVSDGYVDYNYQVYSKLTEEQKSVIAENPLFNDYVLAVYHCFYTRNFEEALTHVNAVLESQGELSQALYLQGAIHFGMKNFEESIVSYEASLKVEPDSPTVWYAMANSYDALKRYEEAYEACLQVEKLLPETDHEFDLFGVGIHNTWLMDRLEQAMGGK